MSVLRVAWRNNWRNSRRTAITLTAISLNVAILIVSYAFMLGFFDHTISNATNMVTGEAQIHHPGYLTDRSMYKDVPEPETVLGRLETAHVPAALRSYGYGLAAVGIKSAGALFWGVDPRTERAVFDLADNMASGRFLNEAPEKGVVLGRKLARSLKARPGSEVVVVVQAADGSLGNELYTVTGILKAASETIDRTAAVIHRSDFEELFVSGGRVHEIALNSRGAFPLERLAELGAAAAPGSEVKTWRELMPMLSDMINMFGVGIWIFGLIFFLAAGMGLLNTMLMATFERVREFGLLKALGTTPWRIVRDVSAEALVLGFLSTLIGGVAGLVGALILAEYGLDMTVFGGGFTVVGVAFDPVWRATVTVESVVLPVMVMWLVSLAASIYPAVLAARLDPVKSMAHV